MTSLAGFMLGRAPYKPCWALQKNLHQQVVAGELPPHILLVEHEPVVTLGKHSSPEFLKQSKQQFADQGIDLVAIDRGGEATAHEPGQLTAYPILPLEPFKLSPKKYVHLLEESVIATLADYGIACARDCEYPGVWVEKRKICAIGVRIKERVAMHGIGFNIANDLATFATIVPCGISDRTVTTISRELDRPIEVAEVADKWGSKFAEGLAGMAYQAHRPPPLQWDSEGLMMATWIARMLK